MVKGVDTETDAYKKYAPMWRKCRIVAEGSEAVKNAGEEFLPALRQQKPDNYKAYKDRALFFEGTTRTVNGLLGLMFSKEPVLTQPKESTLIRDVMPGFLTVKTFLKKVSQEVITVGRVGLLVDIDDVGKSFISIYSAEDIINWRTMRTEGNGALTLVVLREVHTEYSLFKATHSTRYRALDFDKKGNYRQSLYARKTDGSGKETGEWAMVPDYPINPKKNGRFLKEIPFHFINCNGAHPMPDRPPLLGLVHANISHYMNSADLEHGRHFTGLPTPWVAGFPLDESKDLYIGSETAWVSSKPEARAGYLEFTGQGLSTLENALKEKQDLMIVLGARLLEAPKKASESSDNQASRKQGESGILANIADSVSDGVTEAIRTAAIWRGEKPEKYQVEITKDFMTVQIDPAMVSALITAMQGGLMSFGTWFHNLKMAGMIPDGITQDVEKSMIEALGGEFMEPLAGSGGGDGGEDGDNA